MITFKDFAYDENPLTESRFYTLDEEKSEFEELLYGIEASGGGDEPENALEALVLALKSDWMKKGPQGRHVITLCTDASALDLRARENCPGYPLGMPKDFAELKEWRDGEYMDRNAKRLLIFAPDRMPWSDIEPDWDNWSHTIVDYTNDIDETKLYKATVNVF